MATEPYALDKEDREHAEARLAHYLRSERDEEWGDLAIMLLMDAIQDQIGPLYYNRGIAAAQRATRDLLDGFGENLEVGLDALRRLPPPATGR